MSKENELTTVKRLEKKLYNWAEMLVRAEVAAEEAADAITELFVEIGSRLKHSSPFMNSSAYPDFVPCRLFVDWEGNAPEKVLSAFPLLEGAVHVIEQETREKLKIPFFHSAAKIKLANGKMAVSLEELMMVAEYLWPIFKGHEEYFWHCIAQAGEPICNVQGFVDIVDGKPRFDFVEETGTKSGKAERVRQAIERFAKAWEEKHGA
ncbi:MAG: hypothetical protein N2557_08040 [Hydrogenophilus sp.]|nr:hypothetical protein [Hydrogenophilus sp.]